MITAVHSSCDKAMHFSQHSRKYRKLDNAKMHIFASKTFCLTHLVGGSGKYHAFHALNATANKCA